MPDRLLHGLLQLVAVGARFLGVRGDGRLDGRGRLAPAAPLGVVLRPGETRELRAFLRVGGLTAERRAVREGIRLQAGERFAASEKTAVIAKDLRVSVRSVERWRRAWREGGRDALGSTGPANSPTVTDEHFAVLEEELGNGPSAHGFDDERWTLARVQTVIRRRLRLTLSVASVWRLVKRHGRSWQAPARRALERDEHAVELWKKEVWPRVKDSRRHPGPGSSSKTKPASR
ncbi:winged helix-turn-helix domain-containing protein [Streptomyces collinus]|uniref:winged helix-turn-helix domain-containing protein n=1 Tax=Streptomyces collinus TaxID=42684 RepID=UPI003632B995